MTLDQEIVDAVPQEKSWLVGKWVNAWSLTAFSAIPFSLKERFADGMEKAEILSARGLSTEFTLGLTGIIYTVWRNKVFCAFDALEERYSLDVPGWAKEFTAGSSYGAPYSATVYSVAPYVFNEPAVSNTEMLIGSLSGALFAGCLGPAFGWITDATGEAFDLYEPRTSRIAPLVERTTKAQRAGILATACLASAGFVYGLAQTTPENNDPLPLLIERYFTDTSDLPTLADPSLNQ